MTHRSLMAAVLLTAAACAKDSATTDTTAAASAPAVTPADTAAMAAAVSNAIEANPTRADSILQANGHTVESFEALMYRVAADSGMSARYASARTR